MAARKLIFACIIFGLAAGSAQARISPVPQQVLVVDRIVAKIEGDIILLSQVDKLGEFQELIEGHREPNDQLLNELIEQWVVQTEADGAHFPQPAKSEVDREMGRVAGQFPNAAAYAAKLKLLDLSVAEVREMLSRQIYLERYIDYKFRPTVQVDASSVQTYYEKEFLPPLAAKNQPAPPLPRVDAQIREILTQRAISQHLAQWLDETKSHLSIEIESPGSNP